jgi:hypothetical protein
MSSPAAASADEPRRAMDVDLKVMPSHFRDSQYYTLFVEAMKKGKPDAVYQLRRNYVRENMSGECFTLMANMGDGGHNVPGGLKYRPCMGAVSDEQAVRRQA